MKFICGNFKMNGSLATIGNYIESINEIDKDILANVCVCAPFPMLKYMEGANFHIGAQDCHYEESGAFTGDISAGMLRECGCDYVIVGHSERRKYHSESSLMVFEKAVMANRVGITPIVCVGEAAGEEDNRFDVLREQLSCFTPKIYDNQQVNDMIVAYEPVWSVGTGLVPEPDIIEGVCEFISEYMIKITGKKFKVLYGGSVNPGNVDGILDINTLDGVLIGAACLDVASFKSIISTSAKN